ncbi:hypothetical protein [Actinacidiphila acidipaludis]|uniref:Uncharacterized protein n=1 Tax=Actinacidiphila acidipaludis TaxID=2873382 RepID=A0ABS7QHE9_9ACTN|nr:hypothetical protein [Streptomyces acidipaludis]MBY8881204.1 hypothetical protein [Streptomyces acidipaludis]
MDPELSALASSAATTFVTLMATDAWTRVREGLVHVWRQARPDRADAMGAEVEATRTDLLAAQASGDEESEEELRAEWRARLRRLLASDPGTADPLRRLLAEVDPAQAGGTGGHSVTQRATATKRGRVYQAGRDLNITE